MVFALDPRKNVIKRLQCLMHSVSTESKDTDEIVQMPPDDLNL